MNLRFWQRPKPSLPDWRITAGPGNPKWSVTLASCDKAHAESVLEQIRNDPSCPDDLTLKRI